MKTKGNSLPPLQKRILLHLARVTEPKTRNEVKEELASNYKSILFSFRSLEKKGLIEIVSQKPHRKREFPQYWLTFEGLFLALANNVDQEILKRTWVTLHGKSEDIELIFELERILPSEEFKAFYDACKFTKEGHEMYLPIPINSKRAKVWREALKKSPRYQKIIYRILKQAINEFHKEGVEP